MNVYESAVASLKNKIFKILPLREEGNENLPVYLESLKIQVVGMMETSVGEKFNHELYETYCLIEYLRMHEFDVAVCKREVFRILHMWDRALQNAGCEA